MRNLLKWAGAVALALMPALAVSSPGAAQTATKALPPAGYAPMNAPCYVQRDSTCASSVQSTAQTGTVTSSAVTPATGTATFSGGHARIGPLSPTVGFPIRFKVLGTWTGSAFVGTSVDGCATINQLTAGGSPVTYTSSVNEIVDAPANTGPDVYCADIAVTSGTATFALRQ